MSPPPAHEGHIGGLTVAPYEVSTVLESSVGFAGLINPDFLRFNQIVDSEWLLQLPVVIRSSSSYVRYRNGLSLNANDESLTISQRGAPLALDDVVSPEIANRFLAVAPPNTYEAVRFEVTSSVECPMQESKGLSSPLLALGIALNSNGIVPKVQTRIEYETDEKTTTLYIFEDEAEDDSESVMIHFRGHILRNVIGDTENQQKLYIEEVLNGWRKDVDEFLDLALRFSSLYLP